MKRIRKATGWIVVAVVTIAMGLGCGDEDPPQEEQDEERRDADGNLCELYEEVGPYEVGLREVELEDGTPVALFYPAEEEAATVDRAVYDMRDFLPEGDRDLISDEDAPIFEMNAAMDADISGDGSFPVVLFSHGLAGYRYQSSTLLVHLASWGFVVASAEHKERNLAHVLENFAPDGDEAGEAMRAIVEFLEDDDGDISQIADTTQIAATGHSMGGNGANSMIGEPGVKAAIFYASNPNVDDGVADGEGLFWMGGTTDRLINASQVRIAYDRGPSPKRFLGIEDAGHLAFSDICAVGAEDGGVLQIAEDSGMEIPALIRTLGEDGCRETDLDVETVWPIVHHYSVAHLRDVFGIDEDPVGLSQATVDCYDGIAELEWLSE